MFRRGWLLFASLILALVVAVSSAAAQGAGALVAFVNGAGQLAVAGSDGAYRWIITNPGESLHPLLGYAWAPNGRQLLFALSEGGGARLRVADVASQSVADLGAVGGQLSGGLWSADGSAILIGADTRVLAFPASGGGPRELALAGGAVTLRSPFDAGHDQPQVAQARNLSPDGGHLFYAAGGSNFAHPVGGAPAQLPGGDAVSPASGLWASGAPLVAYGGYAGNAVLAVTNAASGATVTLDSGRTAPIHPISWRPGTLHLLYRDASNAVRIADLSCLTSGCGGNPLESGEPLLPASAMSVQTDGAWVYYVDGTDVKAVGLGCVGTGNCPASAVTLGTNLAPQTLMDVGGRSLVYTAYGADPYNAADREVRAVNLDCLSNPATCAPIPLLAGAMSGLVSPDGGSVVVQQAGGALSILRLADGQLVYLSDAAGSAGLARARWNGS